MSMHTVYGQSARMETEWHAGLSLVIALKYAHDIANTNVDWYDT
jgi:hypothetical protein